MLNVITGLIFGLLSLGPLLSHDWVAAAAWGGNGPRVRPFQIGLRPGPILWNRRSFIANLATLQLDGVNGYRVNTLRLPNWSSPARCNKGPPCPKLYLPLSITGLKSAQAGSPSTSRTAQTAGQKQLSLTSKHKKSAPVNRRGLSIQNLYYSVFRRNTLSPFQKSLSRSCQGWA